MREVLDATAVQRWCALAVAALSRQENELNQLNVYPVPDGDTGTNLRLTLVAAQQALAADSPPETVGESGTTAGVAMTTMARGALLGARGNSGVIAAQWLAGLAKLVDAGGLAGALTAASAAAFEAVARPVEGTILTVARDAAAAAEAVATTHPLAGIVHAAAEGAARSLARTPELLPALADAGVVDAGGQGLVILLDTLVESVTGQAPRRPPTVVPADPPERSPERRAYLGPAFEVQFLIDLPADGVPPLRAALDPLGDSLIIVGGDPAWRVHVHVDDVGKAIEAGLVAGRPYEIQVTHLTGPTARDAPRRPDPAARAVIVTASGTGLAELMTAEGAVTVSGNPSTGELLDAILATGAGRVAVLPTDSNIRGVAQAAADEAFGEGVKVRVIPTRSPVQALAALAVRDPARRFEDDVIAMAEAAAACRSAEVTTAVREALTVAGRCRRGDVLALVEGEVNLIGQDLVTVCQQLLDRMLAGGGELVTLLVGAQAPDGLADTLTAYVAQRWPFVELHAYPGGQPHYPLLLGVE